MVTGVSFWDNFRMQAILLVSLAFAVYAPTFLLDFGYALDDGLVIQENPYTRDGVAGIGDLLSKDAYQWYYDQFGGKAELSGGRYRPLSIITFALEVEVFGLSPRLSHLVNVLLYTLTAFLLLYLLHHCWLERKRGIAFMASLLFVVHPIHAEVVANIKSRDEILSLLFLLITAILLSRYLTTKKPGMMAASMATYFLALMSKENGITFLAIFPIAMVAFHRLSWQRALLLNTPMLAVAILYLVIRGSVVGWGSGAMDDLLNDPFLYASASERYGTIFVVLLDYLKLLLWPHPQSYDYGYATFAYYRMTELWPVVSLLLHTGAGILALMWLRRRTSIAFGILFYLITLSIISNLLLPLGATMGERLIYHSSVGFVLAVAGLLWRLAGQPEKPTLPLMVVLLALTLAGSYRSVARSLEWKNNRTLFLTDVKTVPNSIKANIAAGHELVMAFTETIDTSQLQQALTYYRQGIDLYPSGKIDSVDRSLYLYDVYLNMGYCHYTMGHIDSAEIVWQEAHHTKPFHPKVNDYYRMLGNYYLQQGNSVALANLPQAIIYYYKATAYLPDNEEAWYNLGGACFTAGRFDEAKTAFTQTLRINPDMPQAQTGLEAANQQLGQQP